MVFTELGTISKGFIPSSTKKTSFAGQGELRSDVQ